MVYRKRRSETLVTSFSRDYSNRHSWEVSNVKAEHMDYRKQRICDTADSVIPDVLTWIFQELECE
jgi:hypothetical protein